MTNLVQHKFQEPTPQPLLNGALGLTSEQIASTLGSRNDIVVGHAKECAKFAHRDLCFCETKIENSGRGRPKTILVMPIREAKLIAASFRNKVGFAYLDFLIWFEEVAREGIESMARAHAAVVAERDALKLQLENKALPKPKVSLIDVPEDVDGIWGPTHGKLRKIPADRVSEIQRLTYKNSHMGRIIEGCGKSQQQTSEQIQEVVFRAARKAQEELFPLLGFEELKGTPK